MSRSEPRYAPDEEVLPMVLLLIAIDVVCLIVALLTAHAVRFGYLPDLDF